MSHLHVGRHLADKATKSTSEKISSLGLETTSHKRLRPLNTQKRVPFYEKPENGSLRSNPRHSTARVKPAETTTTAPHSNQPKWRGEPKLIPF